LLESQAEIASEDNLIFLRYGSKEDLIELISEPLMYISKDHVKCKLAIKLSDEYEGVSNLHIKICNSSIHKASILSKIDL
jgi:hypothetical protein